MNAHLTAGFLALIISTVLFFSGAKFILDMPIVQMTYPDRACRSVISPNPHDSCNNLPKTYAVKWVAQR